MKKVFWIIVVLLVGVGAAVWWFVRKDNNMYRLVPKDAHIVMSLSIPSLLSEISLDELKDLNLMDKIQGELKGMRDTAAFERIKALKESGSNFGVDLLSDVVLFKSKYEGLDFYGFVFDIADPAEFRKVLTALDPGFIIDMKANYSVMDLSEGTFLAWNKRGGIIVRNDYNYAYAKRIIRSNFIVETFSRGEDKSIISLPAFQTNRNPDYLVSLFVNYEAMDTSKVRDFDNDEMLVAPDKVFSKAMLGKSYFAGGLKHQNQTLIMDGKIMSFETGAAPFSAYTGRGISEAHAKCIANADPICVMGCAARQTSVLDSLVAGSEIKNYWADIENALGWDETAFKSILSSEFSFAFHGVSRLPFDPETDIAPYDRSLMGMDENGEMYTKAMTFSAHLVNSDKALLRSTMDALVAKNPMVEALDEGWFFMIGDFRVHIVETPIGLCITNHTGLIDGFKQGSIGTLSDPIMNGLIQNQVFGFLNVSPTTFNEDTKGLMEKYLGEEPSGNLFFSQFENLTTTFNEGRMELRIKLKQGEEKLINRIIGIFNEIKNPAVS